jgi:hypothetical protein
MSVPVTARAVFQAHIDGLTAAGLTDLPVPISIAWTFEDAAGDFDIIDFPTGNTTLQRPTKATMVIIIPPPTNVVVPVLKGAATDGTGVALSPNCGTILALAQGPQVITTTAPIAGVRVLWL